MTPLVRCDCINVRHGDGNCKQNAVEHCTTCRVNLCDRCARQHHAHNTLEPIAIESQVIPRSAKELMLRVVLAYDKGRRLPLKLAEAALLREHALIDMTGEPTARGRVAAGDILAENSKVDEDA